MRLSTGGFQQITASRRDESGEDRAAPPRCEPSRAASTSRPRSRPATAQAGEPFTLTVKVTNDAGSVIQEINSSVTVEVQNASTQAAGRGTLSRRSSSCCRASARCRRRTRSASRSCSWRTTTPGTRRRPPTSSPSRRARPTAIQLASRPELGGRQQARHRDRARRGRVRQRRPGSPGDASLLLSGTGTPVTHRQPDRLERRRARRLPEPALPGDGPHARDVGRRSAAISISRPRSWIPTAAAATSRTIRIRSTPASKATTIAYKLDDDATVTLRIFTQSGDLVLPRGLRARLARAAMPGSTQCVWDGRNGKGDVVASGGYVVLIEAQGRAKRCTSCAARSRSSAKGDSDEFASIA